MATSYEIPNNINQGKLKFSPIIVGQNKEICNLLHKIFFSKYLFRITSHYFFFEKSYLFLIRAQTGQLSTVHIRFYSKYELEYYARVSL